MSSPMCMPGTKFCTSRGATTLLKFKLSLQLQEHIFFFAQHTSSMMFYETDRGVRTFAVGMCACHSSFSQEQRTREGRKSMHVHPLLRSTNVNLLSNSLKMNVNEALGTRMTAFTHHLYYIDHLAASRI